MYRKNNLIQYKLHNGINHKSDRKYFCTQSVIPKMLSDPQKWKIGKITETSEILKIKLNLTMFLSLHDSNNLHEIYGSSS